MNKALGNLIKLVIFLGLGIFLVWLITHKLTPLQWQRIHEAARTANYWLLIPVCIIGFFSFLFRALRWRLLLLPLGYRVGVFTIYSAVVVGYLANLAIPRMGEVTRCGMLARYERLPVDKVIGTMIVERTFDVICLVLLMAVTILWQIDVVGDFFYDNVLVKVATWFRAENLGSHLLWLGAILTGGVILWIVLRQFRQSRWYRRVSRLFAGIKTGFVSVARLRQKKRFLVYTGLIWLCYFLMVYLGFYCFPQTAGLGTKAALSVLIFGSIGMILTQGGIGAYQLIVERVLLLYGVAKAYGFAFGWLSWLSQTGLILVLGFVSLLAMSFVKRKTRETADTITGP
jgi:uncharacterized protein (TIRG00374 family)